MMTLLFKAVKVSKEEANSRSSHTFAIYRERNMSLAQVVSLVNFSRTFSRALVDFYCSFPGIQSGLAWPVIEGSPHSSELSREPVPL